MPKSAPRPCTQPGCKTLVYTGSRCDEHAYKTARTPQGREWQKLYNSRAWRKSRAAYLRAHPLCAHCEPKGIIRVAQVVDHITPHKGDQALFWDYRNWQGLCIPCHNSKTAKENG